MSKRILIVDDDPAILRLLGKYLTDAGHEVLTAATGPQALQLLLAEGPQIVITDLAMPEMDGLELCRAIRSMEGIGFVYAIMLTVHAGQERLVQAFEAGANDFLGKPFHREELLARLHAGIRIVDLEADLARQNRLIHKANAELAILNQRLERMATTDELTGLLNRREAMRRLGECWEISIRRDQPLACLILDIDHFKRVNDTHGHGVGDVVLRETAAEIMRVAWAGGFACRLGGEEFLVICPEATATEAAALAEQLRRTVGLNRIRHNGVELGVTISVGVAERSVSTANPDHLLRAADQAMYTAKGSGRNHVCIAGAQADKPGASALHEAQAGAVR